MALDRKEELYNAPAGSPEFAELLDHALSKYGKLYSLGNKNNKDRAALIVKHMHGSAHDIELFRKHPESLRTFIRHQDFTYLALRQMSRLFGQENRVRFIIEAFHQSGGEWDELMKKHLWITAQEDNARRGGNAAPLEENVRKILSGDPKALSYVSSISGSQRFAAQCHVNNLPQLILAGRPDKSEVGNPFVDIEILAAEARRRIIDITEIEAIRAKWSDAVDNDHQARHAFVRLQAQAVPQNGIGVVVYGGDHTKHGVHPVPRSVSRFPLEDYLQDDFQLFAFEPNEYSSVAQEEDPTQLRLIPQDMTVEEIRSALIYCMQRN